LITRATESTFISDRVARRIAVKYRRNSLALASAIRIAFTTSFLRQLRRPEACSGKSVGKVRREPTGTVGRADNRSEHSDHVEDLGDATLVERMNGDALSDQRGDNIGLEIGKAQNKIGRQVKNFWDFGGRKGRDARLVSPGLGRAHAIARDARDATLLPQQIEGDVFSAGYADRDRAGVRVIALTR
jgi:hypothetical protein